MAVAVAAVVRWTAGTEGQNRLRTSRRRGTRTSKVVFGSLILDLLGFTVMVPLSPALLNCYSKHESSGLYSSLLSCVTYYQHIIGVPARFHFVLFWWH